MLLQELTDIFSADGPIAQAVPDYRPRVAQLELAQAIELALRERSTLIAEAGTGTGKTWAYLVPAFLGGGKVLVSTGTRTLQDQLFRRDLPRLRKALALPISVALLKGRGNYVCHYHLDRLGGDDRALKSRAEISQLRHIQVFAKQSRSGDRSDLAEVPEDADIWNRVTSTRDNCLGQDCPHVRDCFVMKARRQAQDADLVVVNHALFMADLALREEGITELLPTVELVVFDEAHQLPDIATRFLGSSVSSHQLLDLARTTEVAGLAYARESTNWSEAGKRIEQAARELRLAAAPIEKLPGRKATYLAIPNPAQFDKALTDLLDVLDTSAQLLNVVSEKHPDLAAVHKTCLDLRARLYQWSQPDRSGKNALRPASDDATLPADADGAAVRWVEQTQHHMRLHSAPLSVAKVFSRYRSKDQAWVLTSATLSVHGDFGHFVRQLGLWDATTRHWESPFDYPDQGVLYVPKSLPLPSDREFNEKFVSALLPLIQASTGGVLVLCTTLRAVDRIATLLEEHFEDLDIDRLLLRQGESSRGVLLERFRAQSNAVLVGSASFWEGIDVPGNALTLVAIDKLPFAPPDDPVLEARLNLCRTEGGNPFMEYQLPEAAIALKQGAGRLIRSESDWGVLMVGDTRMVEKPYGKLLWRGLPPFARTREAAQVIGFLKSKQAPKEPVQETSDTVAIKAS
ncbi:ATP-dependent DNA helicase [Pollutimonas thiosulfatoxidans]|uniref:DNA 5'-3' helicase n=1 Tax=Pollutimonas thiosulfatoxidans TaxID=2028345 RepID=A0A410GBY0_9BURK|nr:ATP-dependent DNA helicase [Pollutimonas thiosulfatoxidans]MBF6616197.1 ATP-dependent DNA helicase [Candidimonas sp.]NYT44689.1 ATP-dependent DNA helicase [Alcaligenaceae bacterium]QAA93795.1 helicase [Pollutimonas thiosulfatoxidans]